MDYRWEDEIRAHQWEDIILAMANQWEDKIVNTIGEDKILAYKRGLTMQYQDLGKMTSLPNRTSSPVE
jgi:hypothetical protein